jgi:1-acyl-sn-glycerol-3-phosphate acyltransferase
VKKKVALIPRILWRIRVLLGYSIILIGLVVLRSSALVASLFKLGQHARYAMATDFSYAFVWSCKWICGLDYSVSGLEKLPSCPSVLLANHQSFWENMFVQTVIPEHSWVVKQELLDLPLFGKCLAMVDPIVVDRSKKSSVRDIVEIGVEKINKEKLWMVIFPEGTRVPPGRNLSLKPSGIKLALTAKAPIVIMVHNAGLYWPKGFWIRKPGTIKVKIVDVLYPEDVEGMDVRELTQKVQEIMFHNKELLLKDSVEC